MSLTSAGNDSGVCLKSGVSSFVRLDMTSSDVDSFSLEETFWLDSTRETGARFAPGNLRCNESLKAAGSISTRAAADNVMTNVVIFCDRLIGTVIGTFCLGIGQYGYEKVQN